MAGTRRAHGLWAIVGVLTATLMLTAMGSKGSAARQLTPAVAGTPDLPDPSDCTAEARSLPLWDGTPAAVVTPTVGLTPGQPADAATSAAITALVREAIACANANATLRGLSLVSDDFLRRQFTGPNAADPDEAAAVLQLPRTPAPPRDRLALIAVRDVRIRGDGRAVATVITAAAGAAPLTDEVIFVRQGDRWLIDGYIGQDQATPAA